MSAVDTWSPTLSASAPVLLDHDVLVKVGDGSKAHVFRTNPAANLKRFELADGATVFDIALCGSRGAMVAAAADTDLCGTCANILADD